MVVYKNSPAIYHMGGKSLNQMETNRTGKIIVFYMGHVPAMFQCRMVNLGMAQNHQPREREQKRCGSTGYQCLNHTNLPQWFVQR